MRNRVAHGYFAVSLHDGLGFRSSGCPGAPPEDCAECSKNFEKGDGVGMEEPERKEDTKQAEPELLFHYTRQEGLDGILSSDKIWATHYCFLNDGTERGLGLSLYKGAIHRIALQHFRNSESANALTEYFQRSYFNTLDAYVISFCASFSKDDYREEPPVEDGRGGDRLSQWRGYAPGSQGYCLAFDSQLLRQIQQMPRNLSQSYHGFCNYSENSISGNIETHIEEIFGSLAPRITNDDLRDYESLRRALSQNQAAGETMNEFLLDVLLQCGVFKHVGFQEENEYRMIKFLFRTRPNHDEVYFRKGLLDNTPYIKLPLALTSKPSPLRAVIVGPSANSDQHVRSLRFRLEKMGLSNVDVVPSKIPYRNW